LIEPEHLPADDPNVPSGVDHLWLGPGWGGTVTVWSRGRGRRNERVWPADARPPGRPRRAE
jgi:hypothetical protein